MEYPVKPQTRTASLRSAFVSDEELLAGINDGA